MCILIIGASIGSLYYVETIEVRLKDWEQEYMLEINTNETNSYILICPTIYKRGTTEIIFDNESIKGECQLTIIETEYGNAMQVIGKGNVSIDFHYIGNEFPQWTRGLFKGFNYTPERNNSWEYHTYYESVNNETALICMEWDSTDFMHSEYVLLRGTLEKNGWQIVKGKVFFEYIY